MIDEVTRAAFADELQKIAFVTAVRRGLQTAVNAGWHGHDAKGVPVEGSGWMLGNKGWKSKVPVGGKSMTLLSTALQLPGALGKEDPTGRGHSRMERMTGLVGNTLGGMAATGALMRTAFGAKHPIIGSMLAGIGGGVAGERLATTPWALGRRAFRRYPQAVSPQEDGAWRNNAPGGLTTTPDAVVGQAQAM